MISKKEIWREFIWQEIEESREKYFVVYTPINKIGINYASLDLSFILDVDIEEIANIMEEELKIWTDKYPVPTILFPCDKSENQISLENIRDGNFLLGYLDKGSKNIVKTWGKFEEVVTSKELNYIPDEEIRSIYRGLSYKTRNEAEKELYQRINEKRKVKKIIDFYFYVWLSISILIAVLGFQSYLIGVLAFLYSLYKLYEKARSFKGFKTKKQLENDKKMNKMKHYYYHCELNPEGFLKLKKDNFEKESQDRIIKKSVEIKNRKNN